jgi:hypothetical protein
VPTITISDADKAAVEEVHDPLTAPQPPGGMPAGPAGAIPDWYKVGWKAVGGLDAQAPEGEDKDKLLLEAFLSEQYYGQWYHNAAIVVFVSNNEPGVFSSSKFLIRRHSRLSLLLTSSRVLDLAGVGFSSC